MSAEKHKIAVLSLAVITACYATAMPLFPQAQQLPTDASKPQTTSSDRPGPDENGIYHIGNGVTAPALVYSVAPEFSEEARKHKVTANITVEFIVDNDGHTHGFHVTKTEGWPHSSKKDMSAIHSLESKAIEAVSQYRFNPATFNGKSVPCWMHVEVNFQMI
jgi:hypothetical protein